MDFVLSGHLGIVSDYGMLMRDVSTRGPRYRSPTKPPAFHLLEDVASLAAYTTQRGKLDGLGDDIHDLLRSYPTVQQLGIVIPNRLHMYGPRNAALQKANLEKQRVQILARDYSAEMDLQFQTGGDYPKNPNTATYRRIKEALLIGEVDWAIELRRRALEGLSDADKKKKSASMKASIRQSEPMDAFGIRNKVQKANFRKWVLDRFGEAEATRLMNVQNRYLRTANEAGF
jgi:hypothetical protein